MASVDQGASQRRGSSTPTSSPIGQDSTLLPQTSAGQSYSSNILGVRDSYDIQSQAATFKDAQLTPIGAATVEVSSSVGTSYRGSFLGAPVSHDTQTQAARAKEAQQFPIGQTGNATDAQSSQGTYFEGALGGISPISGTGGGGGSTTTTTYKLRARDSSCLVTNPARYVEWTTTVTPLSTSSFGGVLPCGGPLVELTLLSQKTA